MQPESTLQSSNLLSDKDDDPITYHNLCSLTAGIIVLCLSPFYFGYCLTYLSAISFDIPQAVTTQVYGQIISSSFNGILIGVLPGGALLGAGSGPLLLKLFSRKRFLLAINLCALLVQILIQYPNIYVLLVSRVLQGFFIGNYMAIVPIYINELAPKQIAGSFGVFTQLFVVIALVLSYALGIIFTAIDLDAFVFFRLMVGINTIFIVLQSVLLLLNYVPESPNSLIASQKYEQAKAVIGLFTLPEYVQTAFRLKSAEVEIELAKSNIQPKIQYSYKAILLGFELPFMQQLTGITAIVTEASSIVKGILPELADYTPLIINSVQLLVTCCTVYVLTRVGRRSLILFGNWGLAVIDVIIGLLFLFEGQSRSGDYVLGMLILYMMVYSISLGPVTWLYVPEIMPARIVPLATMMNWFGCSLCVILTPMVIDATGGNPYVAFFSFAAISIVFGVLNAVWVVETKDCTGEQIAKKFLPKA